MKTFESVGINYFEAGFAFRDLVYGLEKLRCGGILEEFHIDAFAKIRFMLQEIQEGKNTEV